MQHTTGLQKRGFAHSGAVVACHSRPQTCGASHAARPAVSRTQVQRNTCCEHRTAPVDNCNGAAYNTQHAPYRNCSRPAAQSHKAEPCGPMRRDSAKASEVRCRQMREQPTTAHAHGRVCRSIVCSSRCCIVRLPTGSNTTAVFECYLLRTVEATAAVLTDRPDSGPNIG